MQDRRDFFKSFINANEEEKSNYLIRPPYGNLETIFQSNCPSCQTKNCINSCEEKIIFLDKKGTPFLDFKESGCTFCEECVTSCPDEVLSLNNIYSANKINAKFYISFDKCIAHNRVICSSCKDPCLENAILFNGLFSPFIDNNLCTSCGFCISKCPTNAIEFKTYKIINEESL